MVIIVTPPSDIYAPFEGILPLGSIALVTDPELSKWGGEYGGNFSGRSLKNQHRIEKIVSKWGWAAKWWYLGIKKLLDLIL